MYSELSTLELEAIDNCCKYSETGEWYGLGIDWLWGLPEDHPFHEAAVRHDKAYNARKQGLIPDESSSRVDTRFLMDCLEIANGKLWLSFQAYSFYALARAWGVFNWPNPE